MPFELHGRDEENVPVFTGAREALSSGSWLFVILIGLLLTAAMLGAGAYSVALHRDFLRFVAALLVAAFISGSVVIGSIWWYRLTREMPHLASLDELSARFGLETEHLRDVASDRRIRPRLRLNGQALYRPNDFGDPASLLRASGGPSKDSRSMLRTAENPAESLPRAAAAPGAEQSIGLRAENREP